MPRKPSSVPSYHKASGWYYCCVKRKIKYLSKDYDEALVMMREMLLREAQHDPAPAIPIAQSAIRLSRLFADYVSSLKHRRSDRHHVETHRRLKRAIAITGNMLASDFRKLHLAKIERHMSEHGYTVQRLDKSKLPYWTKENRHKEPSQRSPRPHYAEHREYSPTSIRDTLAAVTGAFSWAASNDVLPHNPVVGYQKPAGRSRTRIMTRAEWLCLLPALRPNASLRVLLRAARSTGCRPSEIRELRWDHVDLCRGLLVIPPAEHKTGSQQKKPQPRVIPLPRCLRRILSCLLRRLGASRTAFQSESRTSCVFLNEENHPWKKDSLCQAFRRARERAGLQAIGGESIVPYTARHTFGTAVAKEHGILAASKLLGHTSTRTTERYTHLDVDDLIEIRRKVGG